MQPSDDNSLRLLWLAEMNRLNERLQEFSAEVRRHEDTLRTLYPRIVRAFRGEAKPAAAAGDPPTKH